MISRTCKILSCVFSLFVAGGVTTPLAADPAMLLSSTICDNQRDSFDYFWLLGNDPMTLLYFMDNAGIVRPVGHATAFDTQTDVQITIHGNVDRVGPFSGAGFAANFHAAHPTAPDSVTMNVCFGAAIPPGGVSSMARLARSYPGQNPNSTVIPDVAAPAVACSLRASATNNPFVPVANLAQAVYRSGVQHTVNYGPRLASLMAEWNNAGIPYPGTQPPQSYQSYCRAQPLANPGAWLAGFLNNVNARFGAAYLGLVNSNYGGSPFVACGAANQCD